MKTSVKIIFKVSHGFQSCFLKFSSDSPGQWQVGRWRWGFCGQRHSEKQRPSRLNILVHSLWFKCFKWAGMSAVPTVVVIKPIHNFGDFFKKWVIYFLSYACVFNFVVRYFIFRENMCGYEELLATLIPHLLTFYHICFSFSVHICICPYITIAVVFMCLKHKTHSEIWIIKFFNERFL